MTLDETALEAGDIVGYDPQRLLARPRYRDMILVPIPLTVRDAARFHIPRDMTRAEAAKLARIVLAYGAL